MASSAFLRLAIFVGFLAISAAAARPCKTFLISSYSLSITPENPNPNSDGEPDFSSPRFVTVFTVRRFSPYHRRPFFAHRRHDGGGFLPSAFVRSSSESRPEFSIPFISENINSFRDRTRDILSVVVALLFGVGCGALTAATMYLVWALVANRHSYNFEGEDYETDGYDDSTHKKMGYVKIPDPAPVKEAA
ncbi:PREDICTED: uncharacterized protein LOC104822158 [Tarenaya hassleriana]|uniref:uncharacterized protein LOC104822158 n=1 Tax=Tarenaya hassleriana TaxID=28532 RepID=UPI00053C9E84|nr:PREDICTED: uncharacterized protein LOC104822158 [Tarenaya hassleriana]